MGDQDTNRPYKLPMDMYEPFFDTISFTPHCSLVQLNTELQAFKLENKWNLVESLNQQFQLVIWNKIYIVVTFKC